MKKMLWLLAVAFLAPSPSACARETAPTAAPAVAPAPAAPAVEAPIHLLRDTSRLEPRFAGAIEPGVEYRASLELKKGGIIEIALFAETAPNHVANFVSLARKGFYDNVTFHRVLEGFMAQGGDPTGTGGGGPGYTIKAEFSSLPHVRGTISMARTSDPNSGGSQFFICFQPTPFLNGQYTVFGQVVSGMEHADGLRRRDPGANPNFPGDAIKTVTIREIRSENAPAATAETAS